VKLYLYLLGYQLLIALDEEPPNAEIFSQPKSYDQPLIFSDVICIWKIKLNDIFEHISFGRDEHDIGPCSFESVGSIKIHYPMIR
jgi:hypothetical protein